MTYFTGSTANTANPAKDFMEITLHPNLLTAGFTYVEEVLGPTTNTTRIYKSSAAANGVGDWYLIINRTSDSSPTVNPGVCEDYDSTAHLAKKWAPVSVTAGQTLPADRSHYTTAGIVPTSATTTNWSVTASTTAHQYVLSLHPKRVVVSTKIGASEYAFYAGLYDPVPGLTNHFPLMVTGNFSSSNIVNTSYTREPGTGTSVATTNGNGTFTTSTGLAQSSTQMQLHSAISQLDGYHLKPTVCAVGAPASQTKATGAGSFTIRGQLIGVYAAGNAFAWGDIANIDWAGTPVTATCMLVAPQRLVEQI